MTDDLLTEAQKELAAEALASRVDADYDSIAVTPAVTFTRRKHPRGHQNLRIVVTSEVGRTMTNSVVANSHVRCFFEYAIDALLCWASDQLMCSRERLR